MPELLHEYIPPVAAGPPRLMVVLHGLGDSAAGYRWMPGELRVPGLAYQLVNAPDFYYGGYSWFDIEGDMRPGIDRSRRLLVALLDENRKRGFPTGDTFLFGFSQGCLMTLETGLRYPHRFAGLIGISGWLPDHRKLLAELSPVASEQRILVTHGTQDPLLAISQVRPQMAALQAAGLHLTWKEYPKAHTLHGAEELALIRGFITGAA
jgi:phospholipase/carboxylesterase